MLKQKKRWGQVEVFTAVLLTGIFVSSVSAVYIWGVPLIEKRQASAEINAADLLMKDIESAIMQVAQTEGTSQKTLNVNLKGSLEADSNSNSIVYKIITGHSTYPPTGAIINDWLPPQQVGVVGSNRPGVIVARSDVQDSNRFITVYNLTYRELVNPSTHEGILVHINTPRNNIGAPGTHTLTIFKKETKVQRGQSNLQGDLIKIELDVTIS